MKKILLLTDYRNQFWLKTNYKEESVDLLTLVKELEKFRFLVVCYNFADIDFRTHNYCDYFVFYQSSEDPNLFYKSYIADILMGLKLQGAILIPDFEYFLAHHNKVFMEILKDIRVKPNLSRPGSRYFGTYEDYVVSGLIQDDKKYIFKLSEGAQSKNVVLIDNNKKKKNIPLQYSKSFTFYYWIIDQIKPLWKSRYPVYMKKSHHRRKFIIQDFISDLEGDFKVLAFDRKLFVLKRRNRKDDFRASGSGLFSYCKEVPNDLLEYAEKIYATFQVPFMSMDIAIKNSECFLLEFQFVHFGCYTLEKAPFYFCKQNDNQWGIKEEISILEREFAYAIDVFVTNILRIH